MAVKIPDDVMIALEASSAIGKTLVLPPMDPKNYAKLKPILEALGFEWDRRMKLHHHKSDAAAALATIMETRIFNDTKKDLGQFDTPADLAEQVATYADIHYGMSVLEPSCGVGNLIAAALEYTGPAFVMGIEIDKDRWEVAGKRHLSVGLVWGDFMTRGVKPPTTRYDRIIMNPPFAKQADIDHVTHALKFLKSGGKLVAIMGAGAEFRDTKKYRDFRGLPNMTITKLPEDSFRESGTRVNTVLVEITT